MVRVLIPTCVMDHHAKAVKKVLERKGHQAVLWYGADFPTRQTASFAINRHGASHLSVTGADLDLQGGFDVVWQRRATRAWLPDDIHPDDKKAATRECDAFFDGLAWHYGDAWWVNPLYAGKRSRPKTLQLREALACGMKVPPTLLSNDPAAIRHFLRQSPEPVMYKAFCPHAWKTSDEAVATTFTTVIGEGDLPEDDILRLTPGIFQHKVEKDHELRITFMGDRAFPVRLGSQSMTESKDDWRLGGPEVPMEEAHVPTPVLNMCRQFMKKMNLVFGCFDFIVTPQGAYVFLEVNQMGQFLWVELGVPNLLLLDAFTEFLIQGRVDFDWRPSAQSIRFEEVNDPDLFTAQDAPHVEVDTVTIQETPVAVQ